MLKVSTDHSFWVGDSHKVNQDYCLSGSANLGVHGTVQYAIVSDGCSSSPHTDFGSRLLAKAAENNIKLFNDPSFEHAVISEACVQIRSLNLPKRSLDATLVVAVKDGPNLICRCYGDGFIAFVSENGEYRVFEFEVDSGAPYYLNYINENNDYNQRFGYSPKLFYYSNNYKSELDPSVYAPEERVRCFEYIASCSNYVAVVVGSDGFKSYYTPFQTETSKENKPVPSSYIYDRLLKFKNFNGEFLEKRSSRFLLNNSKEDIRHYDDCSLAGISFKEIKK